MRIRLTLLTTLILSIVPLLLALTWVTQYGWGSTRVVSLLGLAVAAYVAARAALDLSC